METHIKDRKLNRKLRITGYCQKCPCTKYLNRTRPHRDDFLVGILSLVTAVMLFGFGFYTVWLSYQPELVGVVEIPTDLTLLLLGLFLVVFSLNYLWDPFFDYWSMKRRGDYPIDETESIG